MLNTESKDLTNSKLRNQWKLRLIEADLSIQTKMVAVVIEIRLDHKTLTCFPSYQSLMSNCKISRPTLMKSLKKLEEDGWITRCRRFSKTTIYSIGKHEAPILIEDDQVVEKIDKHEAPIINEIEEIGKHEVSMIGKYEVPLTLSSNLLLIDPSKEIYTEDIIIDKTQVMELVEGMYWLKNGSQIREDDVEKLNDGGSLKVLRLSEDVDLSEY